MTLFGMYSTNMFYGTGCNMFTNCFGEVNYDALAGMYVAKSLFEIAGMAVNQAISSRRAEKAENENNQVEIENIEKQIADLKSTNPEDEIDASYDKNISTAKTNLDSANKALTSAREQKSTLEQQLASATTDEEKAKINKQIEALNIDEKEKEFDKLNGDEKTEGSVKYYEAKKQEAIDAKKIEIENKIRQLETQKAQLQESVDDSILDKADGNKWKRTSKEDFDKKWNQDGTIAPNTEFTKSDMRYAILGFRNATTEEDKKEWANKIAIIYKNLDNNDITGDFTAARQIVQQYVD